MAVHIGIAGCTGRMGIMLLREVLAHPEATLAGGLVRHGHAAEGTDLAILAGEADPLGIAATSDISAFMEASDVVIDFTAPALSTELAAQSARHNTALVIGTTGFSGSQMAGLERLAARTAILWSPNMSLCVNLLFQLIEQTAQRLNDEYDIEILEMHHRHKADAPSGTALAMGQAAATGRGVDFEKVARLSREGLTGRRPHGEIGFATLRGGGVFGEHTAIFADEYERLELSHKSASRVIYARGALACSLWLSRLPPGWYEFRDMLDSACLS